MQYYTIMTANKTTDKTPGELPDFYSGHNYVIEESVGYLIKHAQLALLRTIDCRMSSLDLTAMQWGPLMLLAYGKGRSAAEISRCAGVDTSTMTRMLDRLEAKGLLVRKRNESDRRVIDIELTEEGRQLVARIPFLLAESLNQHLRGFSAEELETFKAMLRRFTGNACAEPRE